MARSRWHRLYLIFCFAVAGSLLAFAQGTPLTLGPLTVTVPPGWQSNKLGSGQIQLYAPGSTPQQYFQVEFLPFEQIQIDVHQRHNTIIGNLSGMMRPGSTPQNGVIGKFIWTKIELQRAPGDIIISVLYSAKAGSVYIPISVESSPPMFPRYIAVVEGMLRNATLADSGQAQGTASPPGNAGGQSAPPAGAAASLSDYVYAVPPEWTSTNYPDGIVLMSPLSVTNERCVMTISPMRRPSGNLLGDAFSIFQDVYKSYERRNQTNRGTPMPESVVRGTSGQGWDYIIVKKGIAPPGSPESRLGFVFVAQLNNRLAVISGVSKDPLVSTCFGELLNNAWPKFFYSLSFKGWTSTTDQNAAMRRRISGQWMSGGATAAASFTFAGNGRYLDAAGRQTYERINSSEVLATTTAFAGNGAYALRGNNITLTPDNHNRPPEPGFIRVEEESKDDGRSWVDVLYLMRTSTVDGKEYELRMKKTRQ